MATGASKLRQSQNWMLIEGQTWKPIDKDLTNAREL
jgi:hypothetical protein